MMVRRLSALILVAAIAPLLSACAGPGANLGYAIDIRIFESDEQRLEIRNITAVPVEILRGRNGRGTMLAPNATMVVRFRVESLESHLKVADEMYYFRMAGPVTNHFQESDGLNLVQETNAVPVLYFRDSDGYGEVSLNLNDCADTPPGARWESMQWSPARHVVEVPPRVDGIAQPLCPGR